MTPARAAIVAAIIGVFGAIAAALVSGIMSHPSSSPPATTGPSVQGPGSASTSSASVIGTQLAGPCPVLRISAEHGFNINASCPTVQQASWGSADFSYNPVSYVSGQVLSTNFVSGDELGQLPSANPAYGSCKNEAALGQGLPQDSVAPQGVVCFVNNKFVAAIKIVDVGSLADVRYIDVVVTIWRNT